MANADFEFVQGNERLDWGVLVSIDVDRLMRSTNVDALQRVVENIAFSRVTRDEAALFTPDHILHLFQLCQLVIQYLVYSQEVLAKMNVKLNDRMAAQHTTVTEREVLLQRLSDEVNLLKKQVKTQRRTLLAYEYNAQAALARGLASGGDTAAKPRTAGAAPYTCPYCGEEYHKAESMQSHLRKRHPTAPAAGFGVPPAGVTSPPGPPPPPATAAPTAAASPPAASAAPAGEDAATLQQLRHRVEQLEKDKEVMERQQRENLILMMLGATRPQQPASPPPPPSPSATQPPPPPAAPPAVLPSSPLPGVVPASAASLPGVATAADAAVPEHLRGVPVVPDVSAMMTYNLTCQREASENALRRQLVDLEAEIRALRSTRPASPPPAAAASPSDGAPQPPASAPTSLEAAGGAAGGLPLPTPHPLAAATGAAESPQRPAWVAELEKSAQQRQLQLQQDPAPLASPPLSPPPVPTPLAPPGVTAPTAPYDYGMHASLPIPSATPQPPSPAPPALPQPQQAATPPSLSAAPALAPLPPPPPPAPIPPPLSAAAAPPAPTPQPSTAPSKLQHWGGSSSSSSLTSTSTVPPHLALSKGPPGVPSLSFTGPPAPGPAAPSVTAVPTPRPAVTAVPHLGLTTPPPPPTPQTSPAAAVQVPGIPQRLPSPGYGSASTRNTATASSTAQLYSYNPPHPTLPTPHPTVALPTPMAGQAAAPTPAWLPPQQQQHPTMPQPVPSAARPPSLYPTPSPAPAPPPLPHSASVSTTLSVPMVQGGSSVNAASSLSSWSPSTPAPPPPAPRAPAAAPPVAHFTVPSAVPVPAPVKPFRPLSSNSSSDSRFSIGGGYEY